MTDKDVRVRIQIRDREKPIDFSVITGRVVDVQQIAQSVTHVSGGGGGGGNNFGGTMIVNSTAPISSRTESWTTDTIFLKYDGGEYSLKVIDNPVPVRTGNRLAVIHASWARDKTERLLALYNYDTGRWRVVGELSPPSGRIAIALIWGTPFVIFIFPIVSLHQDFLTSIVTLIICIALVSTIPWLIYRAWAKRPFKKRLQAIVGGMVECLAHGRDLVTLTVSDGP